MTPPPLPRDQVDLAQLTLLKVLFAKYIILRTIAYLKNEYPLKSLLIFVRYYKKISKNHLLLLLNI